MKQYCVTGRRNHGRALKRLYKTITRPAVIYGAEGWTVTDRNGKMLMTWEKKIATGRSNRPDNGC
jgi:hypothetical protein